MEYGRTYQLPGVRQMNMYPPGTRVEVDGVKGWIVRVSITHSPTPTYGIEAFRKGALVTYDLYDYQFTVADPAGPGLAIGFRNKSREVANGNEEADAAAATRRPAVS